MLSSWYYPAPIRTIHAYGEGTGIAHFLPDDIAPYGRRLTSNPEAPSGVNVVILGDSHVVADAVDDRFTMGAVLERLSREGGRPLNVRQYGWYGAASADYIAAAPQVLRKWKPELVIVTLNFTDFRDPETSGEMWTMKVQPDLSVQLRKVGAPLSLRQVRLQEMLAHSALVVGTLRRAKKIFASFAGGAPQRPTIGAPVDRAALCRAIARGLRQAYGERLLILYLPDAPVQWNGSPDANEAALLAGCRMEGVWCESASSSVWEMQHGEDHLVRGFHDSAPGFGHFNRFGHEAIGRAMWHAMNARTIPETVR